MEKKDVSIFLAIVFYLLAISEKLLNLGTLSWLYSTISQTDVLYILIIVGTAFLITYIITSAKKSNRGYTVSFGRRRPLTLHMRRYTTEDGYGVKWRLYPPELLSMDNRPWAEGPYCPTCERDLEVLTKGIVLKKEVWYCPICRKTYPKPKGDVKEMVEKDYAAYLRKNEEL